MTVYPPFPLCLRSILITSLTCIALPASGEEPPWSTRPGHECIDIFFNGDLFTSYKYPSDWKFPYLWPIPGPVSGESLTIEKGIKHPHHRSIYFACDKINGGNYWQEGMERGRMVSKGPAIIENGSRVVIIDTCDWYHDQAPSPIRDHRRITIEAPTPTIRSIQFEIELNFLVDVHIEKSNHALFSAEMMPEMSVRDGVGRIENAEGGVNEAGTWGLKSAWCSYFGTRTGVTEGVAIFQHPTNPCYPWPFFTRDYGFVSPTPMEWLPEEGLRYNAGDRVHLTFLVVTHPGTPQEANLQGRFENWSKTVPEPISPKLSD